MDLKVAKAIAVEKCYLLQPYCEIIKIAGGIRRLKPFPHDIEIVVLPKKEVVKIGLFGNEVEIRSTGFNKIVDGLGRVVKGEATGKMMQIELPEKIMLDLFIPDEADFYRQYVIRTGSADYVRNQIATGWRKIGWVGSDNGLRREVDCEGIKQPDGKMKWKCINPYPQLPPVWDCEESFFWWIRTHWIKPELRN